MTTFTIREIERRTDEGDPQYEVWVNAGRITPGWYYDSAQQYIAEASAPGDVIIEDSLGYEPIVMSYSEWWEDYEATLAFERGD